MLSIAYSSVCRVLTLGLVVMAIIAVAERLTINDGWTGIGGFMVSIVFVLPVIVGLVLFGIRTNQTEYPLDNVSLGIAYG